jgi:endonuclease/exonuclease/phosphatase family metal-dependent hydrolase
MNKRPLLNRGSTASFGLYLLLVLLYFLTPPSTAQRTAKSDSNLFEVGGAAKPAKPPSSEFKVVSYNIRWRSGDELDEISERLHGDAEIGGAAIIGLQEVDRNKKRSGNTNNARALAETLGMNYAWAAPPTTKAGDEEATGVAILSAYPLSNATRIVLPHEGPMGKRRAAIGATVTIGKVDVRVYSVHAETRLTLSKKLDQFRAVLEDLQQYPATMPAIVLGDFNTWEGDAYDETTKLFTGAGFTTTFAEKDPTFRTRMLISIELKLDWIWLRGLEPGSYGIDRSIEVSDHWPLWTVVTIRDQKSEVRGQGSEVR